MYEVHTVCQATIYCILPGLCPPLLLDRPQILPDDWQFGCVDHFGLSATVGELQGTVPLPLGLTHYGAGRGVLHLCCHSKEKKR